MILSALIFVPIVAAVVISAGSPGRFTSLVAAWVNLALTVIAWIQFEPGLAGFQLANSAPLILAQPEMRFALGVDGMSLIMVLLTSLVTLAAVWAAPGTLARGGTKLYYICVLLIAVGAMGAFCSTDLFFFYSFHELALIPTFLMIGIFGTGDRKQAAWKITIYLGIGSLVLLVGLAALVLGLGGQTFDLTKLAVLAQSSPIPAASQTWIFLTLVIGFGILVSLFPFHSWAPQAYASAPTPVAMLHAGVLKKFGLYGLLRVALPMLPEGSQSQWVLNLLLIMLLGNILYIGLVTVAQRELDQMLAYSSVMHMGYIFLGIVSWNVIGLTGALLLMFGHGLSIALLFLLSGVLRERTGTLHFERFGGLAKPAPRLALIFGFAAFASIGLPGFANFAGELLIFFGAFKNTVAGGALWLPMATILALWGVVISAVYMLRAYRSIFKGEPADPPLVISDLTGGVRWPALMLVAGLLIAGFFPQLFIKLIDTALSFAW
ncbi:MAG: complex I subunit 4 family protein [Verrucomicrobiales bacterium]